MLIFSVLVAGAWCVASLLVVCIGLVCLIPEDKLVGLIILGVGLGSFTLSCCCYNVHRCTTAEGARVSDLFFKLITCRFADEDT